MTNPQRYLIRMMIFLLVIAGLGASLYPSLKFAFLSNVVINSIIMASLLIGIVFTIRQCLRLLPEHRWMVDVQRSSGGLPSSVRPSLLATVAVMMADENGKPASLSAQNLRSVLDGVAVRLDESREISRYMIGLLVFLGLLGTFWGLLTTVQSVGNVVGGIDTSQSDIDAMMGELKDGLNAPIAGMATAFSSSLFGLGGSLVLGFLDLQLGQASGRFYTDVEDWLSKSIHFDAATKDRGDFTSPALVAGLSEAAANKMQELAKAVAAGEKDRADLATNLNALTTILTKLHDGLSRDALMAENIANLEASLQNLAREMKTDRAELNDTIAMELRALSKALMVVMKKD
ncbi:MAG: MotA/TolQ/ExbB proton channel family protein [Alphaproteobacteria bacterium]|nr:MotA/TolQ/ExbB proton channel family protein [Alphaproteobacteria bacterium]